MPEVTCDLLPTFTHIPTQFCTNPKPVKENKMTTTPRGFEHGNVHLRQTAKVTDIEFPYNGKLVTFVSINREIGEIWSAPSKSSKIDMLQRHDPETSIIIAPWPGVQRQDVFIVDIKAARVALGIETKTTNLTDVRVGDFVLVGGIFQEVVETSTSRSVSSLYTSQKYLTKIKVGTRYLTTVSDEFTPTVEVRV